VPRICSIHRDPSVTPQIERDVEHEELDSFAQAREEAEIVGHMFEDVR
jgi:hypothetical protein